MSVVVIATVRPVREHREEVIDAFRHAIARVHDEDPGCELYALHENTDHLVMVEKWTSPELLDAHGRSAAVTELHATIEGKLAVPTDVQVYEPLPAGRPALGTV